MGKNLKGKECGKGIYQRKDVLYSAFTFTKAISSWTGKKPYADSLDDDSIPTTIPAIHRLLAKTSVLDNLQKTFMKKSETCKQLTKK